ncbi:hypothetical protein BCR35DRAFT_306403 [Leucosporidium creatinivorum]|uniref:Uncharacterized protein n=1 Tax=Leucosporidium creatinivorum TaxID=106004 RepID=A0A1Y2EUQ4_9BASI|nr:hypothetical protein BCR35DRAFT_306403 [Leucosporidium creatinivorum]
MASALPMSTPSRPHQSTEQEGPAPSSSSSFPSGSSYLSSNPHHRRSSFPTSPNLELNEQGKTAAPSYFYLPPGLGIQLRGCAEDASCSTGNSNSSATFSFDAGVGVSTSNPSSRKSSSSSSTTSSSSASSATTLASSFASSLGDDPLVFKRPSRVTAPGEDPQLAAARRALWEDIPEPGQLGAPSPTASVFSNSELEAPGLGAVEQAVSDEDDDEEEDYCSPSDDEDDEDGARPRSLPSHTTRPPLPSCLRPPAPSRTNSQSSSSSPTSTISVRISDAPPKAFVTFSPIDYERKGAAPVEKLSIREWIELQGVREAVGVWSGKIGKWEDGMELSASISSIGSLEIGAGSAVEEQKRCASTTTSAVRERERNSCGNLAAMVGVRTVSHNNSPVEPCRSLFD